MSGFGDSLPADRQPDQLDMAIARAVANIRTHVDRYRQVIATWEPRDTPMKGSSHERRQ